MPYTCGNARHPQDENRIRRRTHDSIGDTRYLFVPGCDLSHQPDQRKGHETCCLHSWSQWAGTVSCRTTGAARTVRMPSSSMMNHAVRHRRRTTKTPSGSTQDRGTLGQWQDVPETLQEAPEAPPRRQPKERPRRRGREFSSSKTTRMHGKRCPCFWISTGTTSCPPATEPTVSRS